MDLTTFNQRIVAIRYAYPKNVFHSFQTQISISLTVIVLLYLITSHSHCNIIIESDDNYIL